MHDEITAQDNRVGIVTVRKEVMIWTVGRTLLQMKIIRPLSEVKYFLQMAIVFHPDAIDTVFLVVFGLPIVDSDAMASENARWILQKYVGQRLQGVCELQVPLDGLTYADGDEPEVCFWLKPRRIDDNGIYSISTVPVAHAQPRSRDFGCEHEWDRWPPRPDRARQLTMLITFNVYEERLSTRYYHLPGGQEDCCCINHYLHERVPKECSHLWGGQILHPIVRLLDTPAQSLPAYKLPVKRALVMAIKSCEQILGPPEDIQYIGGYGPEKTVWICAGSFATRDLGLMYCWVGDPQLAQTAPRPNVRQNALFDDDSMDREVRGDGTFVVLFGEYDYVVWCYDRKIRIPDQD